MTIIILPVFVLVLLELTQQLASKCYCGVFYSVSYLQSWPDIAAGPPFSFAV
jgi:hypothetical protein